MTMMIGVLYMELLYLTRGWRWRWRWRWRWIDTWARKESNPIDLSSQSYKYLHFIVKPQVGNQHKIRARAALSRSRLVSASIKLIDDQLFQIYEDIHNTIPHKTIIMIDQVKPPPDDYVLGQHKMPNYFHYYYYYYEIIMYCRICLFIFKFHDIFLIRDASWCFVGHRRVITVRRSSY